MPHRLSEAMERVGRVAERVGLVTLAKESGLPISTVRSFKDRGWTMYSIPNCEALIAAAERIEAREARRDRRARARG